MEYFPEYSSYFREKKKKKIILNPNILGTSTKIHKRIQI